MALKPTEMSSDGSRGTETDVIVDEILRGERVLLLVPGTFSFVVVMMTLVVGATLVIVAGCIGTLRGRVDGWPWLMLTGIGLNSTAIMISGGTTMTGRRAGHAALAAMNVGWLAVALLGTIGAALRWFSGPLPLFAAATGLLFLGHLGVRSVPVKVYVHFRHRLRVRRQERAAEIARQLSAPNARHSK